MLASNKYTNLLLFSPQNCLIVLSHTPRVFNRHLRVAFWFVSFYWMRYTISAQQVATFLCVCLWQCTTAVRVVSALYMDLKSYARRIVTQRIKYTIKWSNRTRVSSSTKMINKRASLDNIRSDDLGDDFCTLNLLMFKSFLFFCEHLQVVVANVRLIKRLFRWVIERTRDSAWSTWINWLRSRQWFIVSRYAVDRFFLSTKVVALDTQRSQKWLVLDYCLWEALILGRKLFVMLFGINVAPALRLNDDDFGV